MVFVIAIILYMDQGKAEKDFDMCGNFDKKCLIVTIIPMF